ncbi:MAG: alpha-L-fucosidase [Acidobacteria bacterium]|nr:alpha-L-fucosidase [Acidobacteriota bacterium]
MNPSRRSAMGTIAGALATLPSARGQDQPVFTPGPFQGTRESLRTYRAPEWFRDAKFGIWAHWGPQSAPEFGDWYARNMYIEGHRQYKYHVKKYGHPSKFGFKDVIPTWKAEKFDAEALMALYRKAGAKYFVSMGVHHDNFDLWNSRHNPWNAVKMGPKKDILGLFRKAAQRQGLKFGVSEHLGVSYNWFQTSHGADKEGAYKGVPYDGADPKYASLYHETHEAPKSAWVESNVPLKWKRHWYARIKDVLDQYQPDLLYTDGPIFFEEWGLGLTAHLYNMSAKKNGGRVETVYTNKSKADCPQGLCVLDLERGVVDQIWDAPWQTDTCVGHWHYDQEAVYKSPKIVLDMLVDIVSRNGNLLLNFPLPSNGMLDAGELKILDEITKWMAVNCEAIYATRPWKTFGSGPLAGNTSAPRQGSSDHHVAQAFNERNRKELGPRDVRYVRKGAVLYAFSMGWGAPEVVFPELALGGQYQVGKIRNVSLLGFKGKLQWTQEAGGLKVGLPAEKPSEHAVVFRVEGA